MLKIQSFISTDEENEEEQEKVQIPPPFTLPPLSHRLSFSKDHHTFTNTNAKVVAELTSSSDEEQYSSCVEDLGAQVQREKTVVIREILGKIRFVALAVVIREILGKIRFVALAVVIREILGKIRFVALELL